MKKTPITRRSFIQKSGLATSSVLLGAATVKHSWARKNSPNETLGIGVIGTGGRGGDVIARADDEVADGSLARRATPTSRPAAAKVVKADVHPIKDPGGGSARGRILALQHVLASKAPPWLAKVMGLAPEERIRFEREERGA